MNWPQVPLGEMTRKIGSGATPRGGSSVYVGAGSLLIRSQNVLDNRLSLDGAARISEDAARALAGVTVETGDVLINITGDSIARVAHVKRDIGDARINQHVAIIRPNGLVTAGFLQKYLASPDAKARLISLSQGGATRKALTKAQLSQFLVPVPPLSAQQAIAEVLGALDDKIAANRTVVRRAGELSESLFVAACNSPGNSESPLLSALEVKFGEPFSGTAFTAPGVGRPLIRIRDISTYSSQVWTTETRPSETVVAPGDVIAGMDAEFRPSYWLGAHSLLNQRVLWADSSKWGKAYALETLKGPLREIEGEKSATTVIHLNKADLQRKSVQVPELTALQEFAARGEPLRLLQVVKTVESRRLADLRDTLLPHLMSGRITVRQAEALAEEVL